MKAKEVVAKLSECEVKDREKVLFDAFKTQADSLIQQRGKSIPSIKGIAKELYHFLASIKRNGNAWINPDWSYRHFR